MPSNVPVSNKSPFKISKKNYQLNIDLELGKIKNKNKNGINKVI